MKARLFLAAAVAAGAASVAAPANAACQEVQTRARVCYDYVIEPGAGSGRTGANSAQAVCVPSANCSHVGRSGAYYDWTTDKLCVAAAGHGWYCY